MLSYDFARLRSMIAVSRRCPFTLASGKKSDLYFDLKPVVLNPEGAWLIAKAILDRIKPGEANAVGGLAVGAIPLVAAVCAASVVPPRFSEGGLVGFFVRRNPKDHGTGLMIEGNLDRGARIVILEDVVTTGGSVMRAVEAVREAGAEVVKVIAVVDRGEGASEAFSNAGIRFDPIFGRKDFFT